MFIMNDHEIKNQKSNNKNNIINLFLFKNVIPYAMIIHCYS